VAAQVVVVAQGAEEIERVMPRLQNAVRPDDEVMILIYHDAPGIQTEPTIEWLADAVRSRLQFPEPKKPVPLGGDALGEACAVLSAQCKKVSVLRTNCSLTATIESYIRSCGGTAVLILAPDPSEHAHDAI